MLSELFDMQNETSAINELKNFFGDDEKMRTAKKVIRGSLFAYGFVLAIDLILSAIESLIG